MKLLPILTCLGLFICIEQIVAQPIDDTLLTHYRQMALEYDDELKSATKRIEACMELERSARAERIPTLSAGGDFRYTGHPLEYSTDLPNIGTLKLQGQNWRYGASATLSQPIYTGGRIAGAIQMAESETRLSEAQRELLRSELCYRVDVQYWTTVASMERIAVAEEYLRAVAELERIVRERVEAGLCDYQEQLTVEVKYNEAQYRLLQTQSNFETHRMALNALIGLPLDTKTTVGITLPKVESEILEISDLTLHPEFRIAQEHIELEKNTLRFNDAQYKPQLQFGANGGYFAPGYNFKPDLSPNYTLYAQISVPIFQGGKRHHERRTAEYRIGMATDALHHVETNLDLETRTAQTSLVEAQKRVVLASSSLIKACENEQRATEKYTQGAISITEVIDAQIYRQTAQENLVNAKIAALLYQAELMKTTDAYRFN